MSDFWNGFFWGAWAMLLLRELWAAWIRKLIKREPGGNWL